MNKNKITLTIALLFSFSCLSISTGFAKGNKNPKIQWSQKKVVINAKGVVSFSTNVQFESNGSLSNVSLWVVPELQPFISVTPTEFATIDQGTAYSVSIDVSIPDGTEISSYDGTIHLRDGNSTIPDTLKVELSVLFGPPQVSLSETCTSNTVVTASGGTTLGGTTVQILGGSSFIETDVINGAFSVDVPLNLNQVNHLFFTAIGANGTPSAPTSVQVIQDGEPPSLFIDFPEDEMELTTETTDVTGRVGDMLSGFMGLDVTVNGEPAEVIVGIGNNGTFVRLGVPLAIGLNSISATATDKKGNILSKEITVERIEIPDDAHIMEVLSGNGQRGTVNEVLPDPVVVKVTRSDNTPFVNKIVNFKVTRSDGRLTPDGVGDGSLEFQVHTDANGLAQAFWQLGSDAGSGNNRVEATSQGIVGSTFFCASADPNNSKQINIGSGNNQRAEAGVRVPEPLRAWITDGRNGVAGIPMTYTVVQGGGKVNGQDSVTINSDQTGHAEVSFTLGPELGNNVVEATFTGNPGLPATFVAVGVLRDATKPTSFSGLVLDNSNQPIGGAMCSLVIGTDDPIIADTDYDGICAFNDITGSGPAKLFVDGLTATAVNGQPIPPGTFPALSFETIIVPNAANSLLTPILLPTLNPNNARTYDGTQDVELTVEGIDGLKMLVKAGSMTRADGTVPSPSDPATIALNQVHFDDVPMPMPDGAAPPFAWTLQPAGATFDPPVEIVLPNMSDLPAGSTMFFLSFNHATNRFEIVATGSVNEDGSAIVTDTGAGIITSGWGGFCPPYPNTGGASNVGEESQACKDAKSALFNARLDYSAKTARFVLASGLAAVTTKAGTLKNVALRWKLGPLAVGAAANAIAECQPPIGNCVSSFLRDVRNGALQQGGEELANEVVEFLEFFDEGSVAKPLSKLIAPVTAALSILDAADAFSELLSSATEMNIAEDKVGAVCSSNAGLVAAHGVVASLSNPILSVLSTMPVEWIDSFERAVPLASQAEDTLELMDPDFAAIFDGLDLLADPMIDAFENGVFTNDPALFPEIENLANNVAAASSLETNGEVFDLVATDLSGRMGEVDDGMSEVAGTASKLDDLAHFRNLSLTAANQTAPISETGDFTLNNIPTNQGLVRLRIQQIPGPGTVARSPFFLPVNGQTIIIDSFEIVEPPEVSTVFISASADSSILTSTDPGDVGATTQVQVTARLSDGTDFDVTARGLGTTYTSSNPSIATVGENGLVTATGAGTVFITAVNEGATAVKRILVVPGDPLTTVEGFVQLEDGTPVVGADVNIQPVGVDAITQANGFFQISGIPTELNVPLTVSASIFIGAEFLIGGKEITTTVPGGITDVGTIVMSSQIPINGLVAHYPFNGNANDESGNENNGTVNGATLSTDRFGNANSAYSFDGADDFIRIPFSPELEPSIFTIAAWFKTSDSGVSAIISSDPNSAACNHGYLLQINGFSGRTPITNNKILFLTDASTSCGQLVGSIFSNNAVNDGIWHHVAGVYDGSLKLYMDGVLQNETTSSLYVKTGADIHIGKAKRLLNDAFKSLFTGSIDEALIYNRALSESEIRALFLAQ